MRIDEFTFELPEELIAQEPVEPRDAARLLVLHRETGHLEHRIFHDLPDYLRPGDILVLNDTKVIPARLRGRKAGTGGQVEVLLVHRRSECEWEALVRPGRRIPPGTRLDFGPGLEAEVGSRLEEGRRLLRFFCEGPFGAELARRGEMPTPPYIKRPLSDPDQYQTVYARWEGSVAAPTAGLHFTPQLLEEVRRRGVEVVYLTLHVGPGTFLPVRSERVEEHRLHAEYYAVREEAAAAINAARAQGGRIVAVGTTVVRILETVAEPGGRIQPGEGWTDLFIYPGYVFRAVDVLVTNFHLPRSTLLLLVAAFAGREKILESYRVAVQERYRFFSFGDAMLIL